ncbi:MAG: TRAP transporter small permease [Deferrisomatales bacterium]|nr:TRAP transporter small permease [Deferrisomatales bacterium]
MSAAEKGPLRPDHLLAAAILFVMALIAFLNVVSRYFFHFSFAATEELTINLFVWLTVIGGGIAFERGGHLGMVTFYNLFPRRLKKASVLLSATLSAGLFLLVGLYMLEAIHDEITLFHARSPALGLPVWIYYLGVPVCSLFVFRGVWRGARLRLRALELQEGA